MQQQGVGPLQVHGIPGTPVGDLFPPGNAVFGDGNRSSVIFLGARLRGRTATQRSKKGSENVLGRVLGKGSQKGSEKGACYGFYRTKGF